MSQTAISKRITTISEAEKQFNLVRTADVNFFLEWTEDSINLTDSEKAVLDRIKARYRYHRANGHLAEGLVNLVVLSPLLELAGFYDPPFQMQGEVAVEVSTSVATNEVSEEILRGRIDFLVVSRRFWIVVLESKGTEINLDMAIPQTLAYMMANSNVKKPVFGMVTNGGEFFFIKLNCQGTPQYNISRIFSHLPLQNELYDVLKILKRLGNNIT
ncbi:type I restriction endonuclease subunit R [Planktothrix paucivesiculata]|uniref:Type I restriction enzyme R protein N terminal domain protein n=1 Tax=Planktothrix paucivesiculata PCC 9631 TaxID=671071 RepID=A0A7Z9BHJ2_9CYAN|nr:type I restriction endonuclease subunit R [Planktothrix paucivesiculata]VXD13856.1 Type I restriction enzyme R protein N terminal domain protein [Planktothrix paucivesiculata PCC 9631]